MLKLYGYGGSQPSRAVWWTCLIKQLPFEYVEVNVMENVGPDGPLKPLNVTGQIPIIDDAGFLLYEMPAILIYLAEKHGWEDLLPRDMQSRALVHQYLHFHHNQTRKISEQMMAPHVAPVFMELLARLGKDDIASAAMDPGKLARGTKCLDKVCHFIEHGYFRDAHTFLIADHPTLADIACYEEVGQMTFARLYDFANFPKIAHWLELMESQPFHDVAHAYNLTLGDIGPKNPITLERFLAANAAAREAIDDCGIVTWSF